MSAKSILSYLPELLLAALLGTATVGCNSAPAAVEIPPPKVNVSHPEMRTYADYDRYNGWFQPTETVDVRARVRGHIAHVRFQDGNLVEKGQLLFELDPRPFEAEVGRAKDQVKVYEAQWKAATKEETRLKELLTKGGASQSQVDAAEAQSGSLEAEIEAAKAEVTRKNLDVEYARITAPIAGRISRAMLTEGNLVNAGGSDPVLTTIVTVDPIFIYFSVDERSLQRYQKDREQSGATRPANVKDLKLPFTFGLETEDGYPHTGVINFADNRVDSQTGTVSVRGEVKNTEVRFLPGTRVRIRLPMGAARPVMVIPDTAILTDQGQRYVLALDEKNVVQRRDLELGKLLDDGSRVVRPKSAAGEGGDSARAGLTEKDWIIVRGIQLARMNYPVEPIRPPATQPAAAPATAPVAAQNNKATASTAH